MSKPDMPRRCWVCQSPVNTLYRDSTIGRELTADDLRITDSRYGSTVRLYRCKNCDFIFADKDDIRNVESLYSQLQDHDYEAGADVRTLQMTRLLDKTLPLCPHARSLLDIGAGIGLLVNEASRRGLQAEGVEPSSWAVSVGRDRFNATLHAGIFPHEQTDGRQFDIITLIDVIEHVDNPLDLLISIREHLAAKGICVIVTPDVSSVAARLLGQRWWHYRVAHIGFFNDCSMKRALGHARLRIVKRSRATWYFTLGYLAERSAVYLTPLRVLNKAIRGMSIGRATVPLNLFDSWCYMVSSDE